MRSTVCWLPKKYAEQSIIDRVNNLMQALLQYGLWTIPDEIIKHIQKMTIHCSNYNDLLKSFLPKINDPLFLVPSHDCQRLFCIFNTPHKINEEICFEAKKAFYDKIKKCIGEKVANDYASINFCIADMDDVIEAKWQLQPLINFNTYTFLGCFSKGKPHDLRNDFTDGGSCEVNSLKGSVILAAVQPLSQLPPWKQENGKAPLCDVSTFLREGDHIRARLPVMEEGCLTDNAKGHWDLFWPNEQEADGRFYNRVDLQSGFIGRNPMEDVQPHSVVAIDFGTTSTVVAVREGNRKVRLLRVGMQNLQQIPESRHYENPTALELVNYTELMQCWNAVPFRPWIRWDDAKCSHQAKAELHDAQAQAGVVRSGLTNIKTWARRKCTDTPLRLCDQQGQEVELNTPPSDELLDLGYGFSTDRPFNPIELYAYFLGLNLNNQAAFGGRIYREYYMTFPVKFDRETRNRILNSFRLGLLRSLPPSLAYMPQWFENCPFFVREHASEPTAYAAAALPCMNGIAPTIEGVPFGVFDFGGGTTDFCFGLYRLPSAVEMTDEGWETVLDILDTAGDENLGGEHLLHLMVLYIIKNNLEVLLGSKNNGKAIPFVLPIGETLHGSEMLQDTSAIAQSNTTKLAEALRPLWEEGKLHDDNTGQLTLTLWDREGTDIPGCTLAVNEEALHAILLERIRLGVKSFFMSFAQAFKKNSIQPQEFHVLLAGNSCRSPIVLLAFESEIEEILEEQRKAITLHPPLLPMEDDFDTPTLKTGVALGLLKTVPGESVGVLERHATTIQSPFLFHVGRFSNGVLKPLLERNAAYGNWIPFGKVLRHGRDTVGYSLSPLAIEEKVLDSDCPMLRHDWGSENAGRFIFIQALAPDTIAMGLGGNEGSIDETTRVVFLLKDA